MKIVYFITYNKAIDIELFSKVLFKVVISYYIIIIIIILFTCYISQRLCNTL